MKILVIGSGVIGVTYAWQLTESGCDVTLFVKKERVEDILNHGLRINCTDLRKKHNKEISVLYKPKAVSEINENEGYELIIVPVNSNQIGSILPVLADYRGDADILFFHNKWADNHEIDKYIDPKRYFFGFPFKAGGGRVGSTINTVIFKDPLCATMIGEKDGQITQRVKKVAKEFKRAGMNPKVSRNIIGWLWTHYVWAASNIGAYIKAGSYKEFANNPATIRENYIAMREGFNICKARGVDPKSITPTRLFYLPLFLLVPFTRYYYNKEGMQSMFEGHVGHSPEEMKAMYYDVLESGKEYSVDMTNFEGFRKHIDNYFTSLA